MFLLTLLMERVSGVRASIENTGRVWTACLDQAISRGSGIQIFHPGERLMGFYGDSSLEWYPISIDVIAPGDPSIPYASVWCLKGFAWWPGPDVVVEIWMGYVLWTPTYRPNACNTTQNSSSRHGLHWLNHFHLNLYNTISFSPKLFSSLLWYHLADFPTISTVSLEKSYQNEAAIFAVVSRPCRRHKLP